MGHGRVKPKAKSPPTTDYTPLLAWTVDLNEASQVDAQLLHELLAASRHKSLKAVRALYSQPSRTVPGTTPAFGVSEASCVLVLIRTPLVVRLQLTMREQQQQQQQGGGAGGGGGLAAAEASMPAIATAVAEALKPWLPPLSLAIARLARSS